MLNVMGFQATSLTPARNVTVDNVDGEAVLFERLSTDEYAEAPSCDKATDKKDWNDLERLQWRQIQRCLLIIS
jgi:hypothetical protein